MNEMMQNVGIASFAELIKTQSASGGDDLSPLSVFLFQMMLLSVPFCSLFITVSFILDTTGT